MEFFDSSFVFFCLFFYRNDGRGFKVYYERILGRLRAVGVAYYDRVDFAATLGGKKEAE